MIFSANSAIVGCLSNSMAVISTPNSAWIASVSTNDIAVDLNISPLWGLGQLIENEHPNVHCRLIDLDPTGQIDHVGNWFDLIMHNAAKDLAFRASGVFARTLKRLIVNNDDSRPTTERITTEQSVALSLLKPGQLDSLVYRKTKRSLPLPGELEIKVHYTALNFKDVLKVYGTLSEKVTDGTYFKEKIGMEIAGVVTHVGRGIESFQIGDEVVAAISGGFRSYATLPITYIVHKPKSLALDSLFIHITYLTAYLGLIKIARLQPGESVLIHSATGGLGLAAVQIAQWVGAEIFTTAGTETKREYLRTLGITHVMDSRTFDFADEIREITSGRGVNVILNSLSGDALNLSFNLLAPYGRFIEVGKTDIIENKGLPMASFNRNTSFAAIDLDRMYLENPDVIQQLILEVSTAFEKGYLTAIPTKIFPVNETADAFRYMAQAKHIGKVIVKFVGENVDIISDSEDRSIYDPDGTYLITGGTSGFGLEVARWFADKGVGRLVLMSRRGVVSAEAQQTITSLLDKGVSIETPTVDVADYDAVANLIKHIEQEGPPLRGIIHGATVYDDAFIKDIDVKLFAKVMRPKVEGALNLYRCTKDLDIKFFVLFSSISSIVGNRGQANYIAANSFLDEFANFARAHGIPAITINWGALAESGMIARNQKIANLMEQGGISGLLNRDALHAMDYVLKLDQAQIGIFDVDWERWGKMNVRAAQSIRFRELVNDATQDVDRTQTKLNQQAEELATMPEAERQPYVEAILCEGLAKILKLTPNKISISQDLNSLGIDSLMVIELTLAIQAEFGVEITAMELLKQPTIAELAEKIITKLFERLDN